MMVVSALSKFEGWLMDANHIEGFGLPNQFDGKNITFCCLAKLLRLNQLKNLKIG